MSDLETTTLSLSRPGFVDYELRYHNTSVETFHKIQKAISEALLALGDSEAKPSGRK